MQAPGASPQAHFTWVLPKGRFLHTGQVRGNDGYAGLIPDEPYFGGDIMDIVAYDVQ